MSTGSIKIGPTVFKIQQQQYQRPLTQDPEAI